MLNISDLVDKFIQSPEQAPIDEWDWNTTIKVVYKAETVIHEGVWPYIVHLLHSERRESVIAGVLLARIGIGWIVAQSSKKRQRHSVEAMIEAFAWLGHHMHSASLTSCLLTSEELTLLWRGPSFWRWKE
jgi:hypothetical protein